MTAPTVFISYSHDSPAHADRVLELSDRLRAEGVDCILDQYESAPPEGWPRWMDKHIGSVDFVLMICTATYFRRVMGEEEPGTGLGVKWEGNLIYNRIYHAGTTNTRFIPVLFEDGTVESLPTPLQGASRYRLPQEYDDLYRRLTNQPRIQRPELGKLRQLPPRERKSDYLDIKISLSKLPSTSSDLFGREQELAALDNAWADPHTNVLTLVAWGGVGKTALANKWLSLVERDNYRGAERVFGWSFYSQGAAEGRQVSADQFIAAALKWFGDPDPTQGSPWDKGERLAELIRQSRTLLVLDGLEPLQNPPPVETGCLKDPALSTLLRELGRHNPGLVVITTRLAVDDLKDFRDGAAKQIDLEALSDEAGAAYLEHLDVIGTNVERKQAAKEYKGHALALTLLGHYLVDVYDGDVRKRDLIPRLTDEEEQGGHAKRIMHAYEKWFEGRPEQDILYVMGLFDRPAEKGALEALKAAPIIADLTDHIQGLSREKWQIALKHLRQARLLGEKDPHDPDTLDCHPLLREHFGEQLRAGNPKAWREAHSRLYEYYKTHAKELPDTLEEMVPLFAAVTHGCQAGQHEVAFLVYYRQIQRGGEVNYCCSQLGAFGADLAALSGFFDLPWQQPVADLRENIKSFILNAAGYRLRALGRLAEVAEPMKAGLAADFALKDWKNAAIQASNLSELYLTIGDVAQALKYAQQSVELADRGGDAFTRMANRTTLGDVLHQRGQVPEAEAAFREAEEIQETARWWSSLKLVSIWGFKYCGLLLDKEQWREVQDRANQSLRVGERIGADLLSTALDNLSLGRAYFQQATLTLPSPQKAPRSLKGEGESVRSAGECVNTAAAYLQRAVDGLRQAGVQEFIARGLLALAELYRFMGAFDKAQNDLDEAFTIATRGGMRLHEADCHRGYARLYFTVASLRGSAATEAIPSSHEEIASQTTLAMTDNELMAKAREHLAKAKALIDETGYHRRDGEVKEIETMIDEH